MIRTRPIKQFFWALLCLTGFNCGTALAQESEVGNWWIYFGSQSIGPRWSWWNEVQYRNYDFVGDLEQLLLRTGFGYNLTENNNNLLLGYGFIRSQPYLAGTDRKGDNIEHRIYQQFITRQKIGRVAVQHRYRVEERFPESGFRMRFRYFLSINIPLNHPTLEKNTLYLSSYNELFLNGSQTVFDRNRFYNGLGYVINQHFRVEGALMFQMYETSSRPQFQIVLFNNLPFWQR